MEVYKQAKEERIPAYLVRDAGHTQIEAGSKTVIGLSPCPSALVNKITGKLKLL